MKKLKRALAASLLCLAAAAQGKPVPVQPAQKIGHPTAPAAMPAIDGEYGLASSSTAPAGNWLFTKGRLSVRRIDERHLLLLFACEWKREPKAVCSEWWVAQWRDGALYLQDVNTDNIGMAFDPATRTWTISTTAMDAHGTVRTDVFRPDDTALTDAALVRRMKRAESSFTGTEKSRAFGQHGTWEYARARIRLPAR